MYRIIHGRDGWTGMHRLQWKHGIIFSVCLFHCQNLNLKSNWGTGLKSKWWTGLNNQSPAWPGEAAN